MFYQGKKVLVTGATSGIGLAITERLIEVGARVFAVARSEDKLVELQEKHGSQFEYQAFDIADRDAWLSLSDSIKGIPDLVILNAGTCEYMEQGRVSSGLVERVIQTNFLANVYAAEAFLNKHSGDIDGWCVVSSSAGFLAMPRGEAYGASKAALTYFFEALALSYPNVRMTLVHPGFVKTPLTDKNDFPMPMMTTAEKSAEAILNGIENGKREVNHPWFFTRVLRFIGRLPVSLRHRLGRSMVNGEQQ